LLDNVECDVNTAEELNAKIRDIFALDLQERGDEISGTLNVNYADESVKQASLIPLLTKRGVLINWRKIKEPKP